MPNGGGSLPLLPILIVILVVLSWFFGWIVPVAAVALFVLIAVSVAIYDRVSHDKRCRWCNRIKSILQADVASPQTGFARSTQ